MTNNTDEQQSRFEALARFLMDPFLDKPEALKFHTETLAGGKKLWLRAAFDEDEDKGRVFGRGGRNINAMRTVISAAAKPVNMNVSLSVFGEPVPERSERSGGGRSGGGGRSRGNDRGRERPPRASTNPAPPKKKPKA
ncbi:MAG: KH domain-containing protein [Cyanobacteria bacterium J06598_3]